MCMQETSNFIFVPGPGDMGPGNILPRPPLPKALTSDLRRLVPNAVFTSNPARMRWGSQEIVLFRGDLSARMRALALLPPDGERPHAAWHALHGLGQAASCPRLIGRVRATPCAARFWCRAICCMCRQSFELACLMANGKWLAHDCESTGKGVCAKLICSADATLAYTCGSDVDFLSRCGRLV